MTHLPRFTPLFMALPEGVSGAQQLISSLFYIFFHVGNGKKPTSLPPQPGCWIVALPHELQRARSLSPSLDASAPQGMTATAQANGA